jgi:hypothetical protein
MAYKPAGQAHPCQQTTSSNVQPTIPLAFNQRVLADRNTYISGNTNGDGRADFAIKVLGWHTFTSAEFVL